MSNIKSHLSQCSKKLQTSNTDKEIPVLKTDIDQNNSVEFIPSPEIMKSNESLRKISSISVEQHFACEQLCLPNREGSDQNRFNTSLAEISKLDDKEQFIYEQFCQQSRNMMAVVLENGESEKDFVVSFEKGKKQIIGATFIEPDGNCLVSAIAHQLFGKKIGTAAHARLVEELRHRAVEYITTHLDEFKKFITIREDFGKLTKQKQDMASKLDIFIAKLSENGFWCGTETLVAISREYSANIIIINEDASSTMIEPFNFSYKRCAIVIYCAYRSNRRAKAPSRNHYNSISKIPREIILSCMKIRLYK